MRLDFSGNIIGVCRAGSGASCKFASLVFSCLEISEVVLFRHNVPQPTQAQLMRGEFTETLYIQQGVVLSCMFADWTVPWTSRVLIHVQPEYSHPVR